MSLNKKIKQNFLSINRFKTWIFCLFSATLVLACTSDLDNDGAALLGPSSGITIIPQNPQIIKQGNQTFTAVGGVGTYLFSLSGPTDIGTIVPTTGVFTALAIAGTATVTVVDKSGATGRTTVTVLPTQLVIAPGSAILAAAGEKAFTATLISAEAVPGVVATVTRDDPTGETAIPTVVCVAAICTVTASAVPSTSGVSETFTVTITDQINGDVAAAKLTLTKL